MISNNENNVGPTVQTTVEMFPEDFLKNTARETGVVERERRIDPVSFSELLRPGLRCAFLALSGG